MPGARALYHGLLIAMLVPVDTGENPCCQDCLSRNPYNTRNFCDGALRQYWYCPMENTCRLWVQGDPYDSPGYIGLCSNCPIGYYKSVDNGCSCRECRSCGGYFYPSTVCTPNQNAVCTYCGDCGVGYERQAVCTPGRDPECKSCEPGKYRSDVGQSACQPCKVCDPKQRQRRVGCTATVDETCATCSPGFIVTAAQTCQQCTGDTYALDEAVTCAPCTTCTRTQKQRTACSSTTNRECTPCDANERTLATNAVSCDGCVEGYFRFGTPAKCTLCAGMEEPLWCATYQYRRCYTELGMGLRQCLFCDGQNHASSTKCADGQGVSEMCRGSQTSKLQCQDCEAGTHRPAGTPFFEGTHQRCVACPLGTFKAAKGTANCVSCTVKPANSQFSEWEAGNKRMEDKCPW